MSDNTSEKRPEHPLKKQRAAYSVQKRNAKQRGIEWKFTFAEWWAWWQIDSRWSNRGMGRDKFVMARKGDTGPYSPENVYCATHSQNMKDVPSEKMRRPVAPGSLAAFKLRGAKRHNSFPIETPAGRFGNATEAAEHFGLTRQGIYYRLKAGWDGWRYADKEAA